MSIYIFLKLIGSLAFFMYGMRTMSESLQKIMGDNLRSMLGSMKKNHFSALFTGIFVTACIQSSTVTTVMMVSFVNMGLYSLAQAISIIMGANIGATITSWLIAFVGFKWDTALLMLPLFALALPFIFSPKSKFKSIGELILGFSLMFLGLAAIRIALVDSEPGLMAEWTSFFSSLQESRGTALFLFSLFAAMITLIVQFSAVTQAITFTLCYLGIIDLSMGTAIIIGENIGSSIIPYIISLKGNSPAKRAGLAHLVFNLFGAFCFLLFFNPIIHWTDHLITSVMSHSPRAITVTFTLASLHTIFNLIPTLLLIWFVKPLEKFVSFFIPVKEEDDEEIRLQFISGGLVGTGELSILQSRQEIALYCKRAHKMFNLVQTLLRTHGDNEFNQLYSRIEKYEMIIDKIEVEIAYFLNSESEGRLSSEGKQQVRSMMREITEIESIGDCCSNLARTLNHKRNAGIEFTEMIYHNLERMMNLTGRALGQMEAIIAQSDYRGPEMTKSYELEKEINQLRSELKTRNLESIDQKEYDYKTSVVYMDMITECERLGDFIINVIEANGDSKLGVR